MKSSYTANENDMHLNIVGVAERLFRQIGFQKTTVADIACELHMSPANIYRFFAAKAEINEAVGRRILHKIEDSVEEIARLPAPAGEKLRNVIATIERLNAQRFMSDRRLHELFETAYDENWSIMREHFDAMDKILAQIIEQGMAAGEFRTGDAELAAMLVRSACMRFCHPRLIAECAQDPEPTIDHLVDFCIAALS